VRFARREQGLGRADRRGKKGSWCESLEVGFEGCSHMSGER
jgi:hypothetical protein